MSSKIKGFVDINDFKQYLNKFHSNKKLFVTSGGFDPVHVGHLRCFNEMRSISWSKYHKDALTVIVVNGDGFLERKKGFAFMNEKERLEIISGFRSVDLSLIHI